MSAPWRYMASLLLVLGVQSAGARALASLTFGNPFHPEQCDLAISRAERVLAHAPGDARAQALRAEGFLCRGLAHDDPWALHNAIRAFEEHLSGDGRNFFARLYAAEALRRRYPLSEQTVTAFDTAAALLLEADVGEARADLQAHLRAARAAVAAQRRQFLPLLQRRLDEYARGVLQKEHVEDLLNLLAQTGAAGARKAIAILNAMLGRRYDPVLDTFQRAELLRGRRPPEEVASLYRSAAEILCREDAPKGIGECSRARWRLQQLDSLAGTKGGMQ